VRKHETLACAASANLTRAEERLVREDEQQRTVDFVSRER
jgi:hypothetical protein